MYATPGRWSWRCRAMLPPGAMVSSRSRNSRPCRAGKSWSRGRAPSRFSARTPWVTVAAGAGAPADRPDAPAGVAWTSWGGTTVGCWHHPGAGIVRSTEARPARRALGGIEPELLGRSGPNLVLPFRSMASRAPRPQHGLSKAELRWSTPPAVLNG
jgi:hypothetical protein